MEFRLLGPVDVLARGVPVSTGRRRERLLLAVLLLEPNAFVPVERLIDLLWGEDLPDRPRKALQVHVSRLRGHLAAARVDAPPKVVGGSGGYAIQVDAASVDAHRFTELVAEARRDADPDTRAATLRTALALWRGPALADVLDEPLRWQVCAGLEEARLAALELRVQADLDAGRHAELVPELADLVVRHPSRERLVAARMLALHRSGRRQDALDVYRDTTAVMARDLGLDPPPVLRELQQKILAGMGTLTTARPAPRWSPPSPAQLPRDLPVFAGRAAELAQLLAPGDPGTVAVSAVHGMAGVGKTALVVHAAHLLAGRCPDGQLYLDLHGHTEGVPTLDPAGALNRLLRTLGVPGERVPEHVEERAALYRSLLAGRKMLVLLDNAEDEAQVEPLLPAAPGCVVLVTSRHRLVGLDQVRTISLDVLSAADAVILLTAVAGPGRLDGTPPGLLGEIVRLCGHLPLAIQIAAARLRANPAWGARELADLLADESGRLGALAVGRRSVYAALDQSYTALAEAPRRLFRLLGLHPGSDLDTYAATALTGASAGPLLDDLRSAHLIDQPRAGRYRFHDLVREFARDTVERQEPPSARTAALGRLFDHYAATVTAATDLLYPYDSANRPTESPAGVLAPFADKTSATAWLDEERATLLAMARYAAAQAWVARLRHLSHVLFRYLWARSHLGDAHELHRLTLDAADAAGDDEVRAYALTGLANVESRWGHNTDAVDHFERAVVLFRRLGDDTGLARTFNGLGRAHADLGEDAAATRDFEAALELHEKSGNRTGQARTHSNLANLGRRAGRLAGALAHCRAALTLFDETGNPGGTAMTLDTLGEICQELGAYEEAADHHRRAAALHRELADTNNEATAVNNLGRACRRLGRLDEAADHHRHAARLYHGTDDMDGEAAALAELAAITALMR